MSGMEKERIRIGGLVKQSFVDWDGVLSAVVFTKGCNFRCSYCHNPALVVPALMRERPDVAESEVFDYLARRRGWLDGVVVTGGEPTLHAGLPAFLERVKALGYRVKLDTNGTNPEMLRQLIASGAVDFVAMDIKHFPDAEHYGAVTPLSQAMMDNVLRSIGILRRGGTEYELRTTLLPGIHTPPVRETLRMCSMNFGIRGRTDWSPIIRRRKDLCRFRNGRMTKPRQKCRGFCVFGVPLVFLLLLRRA